MNKQTTLAISEYIQTLKQIFSRFSNGEIAINDNLVEDYYIALDSPLNGEFSSIKLMFCDYFRLLIVPVKLDLINSILPKTNGLCATTANENEGGEKSTRIYIDNTQALNECANIIKTVYETALKLENSSKKTTYAEFQRTFEKLCGIKEEAEPTIYDYIVFDIETTGLDTQNDEIIEIGAVAVQSSKIVDTFSTLIKPKSNISSKISQITGITNEMLEGQPTIDDVMPKFLKFIGNNLIIGHNIDGFDLPFCNRIANDLNLPSINNITKDTLIIARENLNLNSNTLSNVAYALGVKVDITHRAVDDCIITMGCYEAMKGKTAKDFQKNQKSTYSNPYSKFNVKKAKEFTTTNTIFDETHPLYGKTCVFTGDMENLDREQSMQRIVDIGGLCADSITKKSNILVIGGLSPTNKKSGKVKKAEEYNEKGLSIEILTENNFAKILNVEANAIRVNNTEEKPIEPIQQPIKQSSFDKEKFENAKFESVECEQLDLLSLSSNDE